MSFKTIQSAFEAAAERNNKAEQAKQAEVALAWAAHEEETMEEIETVQVPHFPAVSEEPLPVVKAVPPVDLIVGDGDHVALTGDVKEALGVDAQIEQWIERAFKTALIVEEPKAEKPVMEPAEMLAMYAPLYEAACGALVQMSTAKLQFGIELAFAHAGIELLTERDSLFHAIEMECAAVEAAFASIDKMEERFEVCTKHFVFKESGKKPAETKVSAWLGLGLPLFMEKPVPYKGLWTPSVDEVIETVEFDSKEDKMVVCKNGVEYSERAVRAFLFDSIWSGEEYVSKTVYRRAVEDLVSTYHVELTKPVWSMTRRELIVVHGKIIALDNKTPRFDDLDNKEAKLAEKKEKGARTRLAMRANKGKSRVRYRNATGLVLADGRLRVESGVRNPGALERMAAKFGWDKYKPIAVPVVSEDAVDEDHQIFPVDMQERLVKSGYFPAAGKTVWSKETQAWDWINKHFPSAVEFVAYGQGLVNSACVEWHEFDLDDEIVVRAVDLGIDKDGHWTYDPEKIVTPADMDGACVFGAGISEEYLLQCRYLHQDAFAKGLWVRSDSVPAKEFWICKGSLNGGQFKGALKDSFKKLESGTIIPSGVLGVLAAHGKKNHMRQMQSGFEVWENIPATKFNRIVTRMLTGKNARKLLKKGKEAFVAQVVKDDPFLASMVQILEIAGVSPWSVGIVRARLVEALQQKLWKLAQGAGMTGRRVFSVIDNGIKPGQIVANLAMFPGAKYGDTVALWRFPIVHEQGLQLAVLVEPSERHLVDGEVPMDAIFFHKSRHDAAQGDDDGDCWAVTTDQAMIGLFATVNPHPDMSEETRTGWEKRDNAWYPTRPMFSFEPVKASTKHSALIEESLAYCNKDNRGPVGRPTMWRATFKVVGDDWAALAMSVMVQYFVDMAKRTVNLPDWRFIANFPQRAWEPVLDVDGNVMSYKLSQDVPLLGRVGIDISTDELIDQMTDWYNDRMVRVHKVNFFKLKKDGVVKRIPWTNLLGWRSFKGLVDVLDENGEPTGETEEETYKKVIHLDNWTDTITRQGGDARGNLVHEAFDYAQTFAPAFRSLFGADEGEPELDTLLHDVFEARGVEYDGEAVTELIDTASTNYQHSTLRAMSGLKAFATSWGRIAKMAQDSDNEARRKDEAKRAAIDRLEADVKGLSVEEILALWFLEIQEGRVNNALRLVATQGNAVAKALGLENAAECDYMSTRNSEERTIENVMVSYIFGEAGEGRDRDIFDVMAEVVPLSQGHMQAKGISLMECPCCMDRLQDALVRTHRSTGTKITLETKGLVEAANAAWEKDICYTIRKNSDITRAILSVLSTRPFMTVAIKAAHSSEAVVIKDVTRLDARRVNGLVLEAVRRGIIAPAKEFVFGLFGDDEVFKRRAKLNKAAAKKVVAWKAKEAKKAKKATA